MKKIITFFLLLLTFSISSAQPGFDDDVNDIPIDGGILEIMGASALYGLYKYRKSKRNKLNE